MFSMAVVVECGLFEPVSCSIWDITCHIKEAVKSIISFIFEQIKKAVWFVTLGIFNMARSVAASTFQDVSSALQQAKAQALKYANETMNDIFGTVDADTTDTTTVADADRDFMMQLMYTGFLPDEWYYRPVDMEKDEEHLQHLVNIVMALAAVTVGVTSVCILIVCILMISYFAAKAEWKRMDKLEEDAKQKLVEREKKGIDKATKEAKKAEADERDYMFMLTGNMPPSRFDIKPAEPKKSKKSRK